MPSRSLLRLPIAVSAALLFAVTARSEAVYYRFASVTTGAHANALAGTVAADGRRCRIDFDPDPAAVREMTAIVCGNDGELLALNSLNDTWYRLKSRTRLAISSPLFTFHGATPSKVKVITDPPGPAGHDRSAGRVRFSYHLDFTTGGEHVPAEVWGEIEIWAAETPHETAQPWKPADVDTGYPAVDDDLRRALAVFAGIHRTVTTVSRRIANGETLSATITRSIERAGPPDSATVSFAVPPDYRYQEPVVGAPDVK